MLNAFHCAFLAFCRILSKCRKHNYFLLDFLLILNLLRILKLYIFESSHADCVMFWWFEPITFLIILHIQRFLVITNRDFYDLLELQDISIISTTLTW